MSLSSFKMAAVASLVTLLSPVMAASSSSGISPLLRFHWIERKTLTRSFSYRCGWQLVLSEW
jgi:hypothetical protein